MFESLLPAIVIGILIAFNGVFVAAEFAIVSARRTRIDQLAKVGNATAKAVLTTINDPTLQNRYITTSQLGVTLVSLGLGMYGEHALADWFLGFLYSFGSLAQPLAHLLSSVLAIGFLTYLHVVIGEMIPKSLALQSPEQTALRLSQPMMLVEKMLLPIVLSFQRAGVWIVGLLGVPPATRISKLLTPDELEFIIKESSIGGMINSSEHLFIENIFDLQERTVEQVLTPRTRVVGIPISAGEDLVMRQICESKKTRYPVYENDLDQIVGILHIKDLARHIIHPTEAAFRLEDLVRPAIYVPESLPLDKLLMRFQQEGIQLAVAIDEFGGTAGIVTIEDLEEEVVGEIQDEFDHEILPIEALSGTLLRVRGDLILDELNQHYELGLTHEEATTIGGLMMALLGRIPKPEDRTTYKGIDFEIESVDGLAVKSVLIHLPSKTEPAPEVSPDSESE